MTQRENLDAKAVDQSEDTTDTPQVDDNDSVVEQEASAPKGKTSGSGKDLEAIDAVDIRSPEDEDRVDDPMVVWDEQAALVMASVAGRQDANEDSQDLEGYITESNIRVDVEDTLPPGYAVPSPEDLTAPAGGVSMRGPRARLIAALNDVSVKASAQTLLARPGHLEQTLEFSQSLALAYGNRELASKLESELEGYEDNAENVPDVRRATGFASPFPVRALEMGLLDPEEIFLTNHEKFSQVTLTIGQPISELEQALNQLRAGGVLTLKVPASDVTGRSAHTTTDVEVYIYILPREIQRIVESARVLAQETIWSMIVHAAAFDEEDQSWSDQATRSLTSTDIDSRSHDLDLDF